MISFATELPNDWILEDGYPYSGSYLIHECPDTQSVVEVSEVAIGFRFVPSRIDGADFCTSEVIIKHSCTCGAYLLSPEYQGLTDEEYWDWFRSSIEHQRKEVI